MYIISVACALVPPIIAIAIERFSPIDEEKAEQNADQVLINLQPSLIALFNSGFVSGSALHPNPPQRPTNVPSITNSTVPQDREIFQDVRRDMVSCTVTAAELSGLVPTFIASIMGAFAIFAELHEPLVPLIAYFTVVVILALFIFALLSGKSYTDIAETGPPLIRGSSFNLTYLNIVSKVIYLVNGLLILVALSVIVNVGCGPDEQATAPSKGKSDSSRQLADHKPKELKVPHQVCTLYSSTLGEWI